MDKIYFDDLSDLNKVLEKLSIFYIKPSADRKKCTLTFKKGTDIDFVYNIAFSIRQDRLRDNYFLKK